MSRRADRIRSDIFPQFCMPQSVYRKRPSFAKCACCRSPFSSVSDVYGGEIIFPHLCQCKSRAYCSTECINRDASGHQQHCKRIKALVGNVNETADHLVFAANGEEHVHRLFGKSWYISLSAGGDLSQADIHRDIDFYFDAREMLIKELINEGVRSRGEGIRNDHAFEVALTHCEHLFYLRRYTDVIFHLYLMTGRIQEFYNLSCLFAVNGAAPHDGHLYWEDDEVDLRVTKPTRRLSRSLFHQDSGECSFVVATRDTDDWTAMCCVLIAKYQMHTFMKSLSLINERLDSEDCISIIGQYIGMKREWIRMTKDFYRDQAMEVARLLHCNDRQRRLASGSNDTLQAQLNSVKTSLSADYLPSEMKHLVHSTIDAALQWIADIEICQRRELTNVSPEKWKEIIRSYKADHGMLYTTQIRPSLPWAIRKVNKMAGYDAISEGCSQPGLCLTKFFAECVRACPNWSGFFLHLIEYIDNQREFNEDGSEEVPLDESLVFDNKGCFSTAVMACLLIERLLAQCHLHKNKQDSRAVAVLDSLPGGREEYISDLPPEDPKGLFSEWILDAGYSLSLGGVCDAIEEVLTEWPPDVTKLVKALFEAGLATDVNLATLFGNSGFVAYQLWKLQQQREKKRQRSIAPFVTRTRFWAEGCVDNDKKKGLKIRYLTKTDQRRRFGDVKKLVSVGNSICHLQPSLDQFAAKFGREALKIDPEEYGIHILPGSEESKSLIGKRPRYELDEFASAEEACRHFFDSSSIEDSIWDFLGVPRVVIMDADEEKMQKAGWQCRGSKSTLGEKSVLLGSRVAHVFYCGGCTVWEEDAETMT